MIAISAIATIVISIGLVIGPRYISTLQPKPPVMESNATISQRHLQPLDR